MHEMKTIVTGMLVLVSFIFGVLSDTVLAEPQKFVQDRFAISFWIDPPISDQNYKDIADANFTVVIGGYGAVKPDQVKKQIQLCEKYDLKAIVSVEDLSPDQYPTSQAVWGYKVKDEPPATYFPKLKEMVEKIRKVRPGRITFINLYPNYANEQQLGTTSYDEYVRKFVDEVKPYVLSMDHYPWMFPNGNNSCEAYCSNLAVMRKYSLQKDIPFWNFFNAMPFYTQYDPTEAVLRWQIYTSIAYGAKGVMYFCYQTDINAAKIAKAFEKGGAILTRQGRKTRHYEQAKRINFGVKNLGPTLMKLTSTAVYLVKPTEDPNVVLKDAPIKLNAKKHDSFLIGVFKHEDGRTAVLLNNYNFAYTTWPTVTFDVPAEQVREVCKKTGKEIEVIDDSPEMKGLQVSLDAAEGRLFLLSPK